MDILRQILLVFSILLNPQAVPQIENTTLILGGDVMLGRTVMKTSLDNNDPTYPFLNIKDLLENSDITFVNLENPIIEDCPTKTDGMIFCAKPLMLDGLNYAGVDIVSLANNHTLNYAKKGLEETQLHLSGSRIEYTGIGNLVLKDVKGTRFGFLGFEKSQLGNPKLTTEETSLIKESNEKVDVLVIAMHWGVEYKDKAIPGVKALAKELVSLGADVVVGHHPHWVEDYDYIEGKPVYYSLGNLVFDQMWSEKTREGLVVKLTFEKDKIIKEEFIKTYMANWAQPEVAKQ